MNELDGWEPKFIKATVTTDATSSLTMEVEPEPPPLPIDLEIKRTLEAIAATRNPDVVDLLGRHLSHLVELKNRTFVLPSGEVVTSLTGFEAFLVLGLPLLILLAIIGLIVYNSLYL